MVSVSTVLHPPGCEASHPGNGIPRLALVAFLCSPAEVFYITRLSIHTTGMEMYGVDVPFLCDASLTFSPLIPSPGAVAPIAVLFSDAGDSGIVVVNVGVPVERQLPCLYTLRMTGWRSDVVEL
jgi:hypothetical protein